MTVQMRSVRQIFKEDYSVGAFQRGYSWDHDNVAILLRDFARAFERRKRPEVSGAYYLGAVVIHVREGYRHIIDGQQRLTTLLLLLIYLVHEIGDRDRRLAGILHGLIVHSGPRDAAFAIDVAERDPVFRALYDDPGLMQNLSLENDTDRTIVDRYLTIGQAFPEHLRGEQLKKFIEWMIDNVQMPVVEVDKESDAYTIFETTNDRGQKLGSGQLTKNFLQANIIDTDLREEALIKWTATMRAMQRFGTGGDREFVQEWLTARYAQMPVQNGKPNEPDQIEDDHFNWLKHNTVRMGLNDPDACYRFMNHEMAVMAEAYVGVRERAEFPRRGWDSLYFLDQLDIGWRRQARMVMLATVHPDAPGAITAAKLRAAAAFMEIFSARLFWQNVQNNRLQNDSLAFLQRTAVLLRDAFDVEQCCRVLQEQLVAWPLDFRSNTEAGLPSRGAGTRSRRVVHTLLARMSACFDEAFRQYGSYAHYELRSLNRGYSIEHILPNDSGKSGFLGGGEKQHQRKRNRFGALLLVSSLDNQRLGDKDFAAKRELYQNMTRLARTLHPDFFEQAARERLEQLRLPFKPYDDFTASDVDERQEAMIRLAELTWGLARIPFIARPGAEEDPRVYALPPWPGEKD
ncbi:MAG: DUF262 domain-containing HNH endonuclease family protein [Maricaulaceae bacterium]|jgi:hypothetical protein